MPYQLYEMMKSDDPQLIPILQNGGKLELQVYDDIVHINGKTIRWEDLVKRGDYYPMSRYVFNGNCIFYQAEPLSVLRSCFNIYPWTELTSLEPHEFACIFERNLVLQVILYPETKKFTDAMWMINVPTRELLVSNFTEPPVNQADPGSRYEPVKGYRVKDYLPKPIVTGPTTIKPNETALLNFEYQNWRGEFTECDFDTYIKYDAGYLPKNVVRVLNGKAQVKVSALGLEPGDTITCKFSLGKVYTNAIYYTLTVEG